LFPLAAVGALAAGLALVPWLSLSKDRVSASYILLSLGISAAVFWLFHLLCDRTGVRLKPLRWRGRNPLLLYVLHYVLLGIFVLPGIEWWHLRAPAWLIPAQLAGLLGILGVVAWILYRKRIVLSL
jgi:predicted acyltransferase